MIARNIRTSFVAAAILMGGLRVARLDAQSPSTATQALQKAHVMERLAEAKPTTQDRNGAELRARSRVAQAAAAQLGHRRRRRNVRRPARPYLGVPPPAFAQLTTDSGMQGAAGKDAKGKPISALGFPRPYGQLSGCCMPAPSVLEFDKAGNLLQAWGGPGDPGFLETKCRQQDGCFWPAREHGIYVDQNDFVYVAGNGQARNFHGQYPVGAELRKRFADPEIQDGRHLRLPDRHRRREGPEQQRHQRRRQRHARNPSGRPT